MKRFKKPATVWLGRRSNDSYELGAKKTGWEGAAFGFDAGFIRHFCRFELERVTGIRLEPGELVKVRITIEEVK